MDVDGCDSSRIGFFWYVTKITLKWNVVQSWIVDIFELYGLWIKLRNLLILDLYRRTNLLRGFTSSIT